MRTNGIFGNVKLWLGLYFLWGSLIGYFDLGMWSEWVLFLLAIMLAFSASYILPYLFPTWPPWIRVMMAFCVFPVIVFFAIAWGYFMPDSQKLRSTFRIAFLVFGLVFTILGCLKLYRK